MPQEKQKSTKTLAEALRASVPASQEVAGLAKRLIAAQPAVDHRASLSNALAAIQAPRQAQESLSKALAGNSETSSKAIEQICSGGIASAAIKEQLAQLTPPWAKEAKMAAQSLSQAYAPIAQAAARARMSPAFGGTLQPPSARAAALTGQPSSLALVSPVKTARAKVAPARFPVIHNRLLDPQPPAPYRRREIARPVAPTPAPVMPQVLPQELGELFAQHLTHADRQDAEELLVVTGLELELEQFRVIAVRLLSGTRPDQVHAALSSSLLLKGLADHLFPPQEEAWESRFGRKHEVGAKDVANRLSAFVDLHLHSELTTQEHKHFQATLDCVFRWSGEGHHVAFTSKKAAEAFCQLLQVLAVIFCAHQAAGSA